MLAARLIESVVCLPFRSHRVHHILISYVFYFNRDVNDDAELDPEIEDLIAKEELWLREWRNEDGDESMEVDENGRETSELDDESLAQMKRLFEKALNAEAESLFTVWETIAERVCAFIGQVSTFNIFVENHVGDKNV